MQRRRATKQAAPSLMRPEDFGIGHLFERVPDAIIVREAGCGRIVLWNPAAAAMFGYAEDEILGHPLALIIPGGLPAERRSLGLLVVAARRKDGQALAIELSSSPITNARLPGSFELTIARDLTAQLAAEAALKDSEARFKAFMDAGPVVAFMRDGAGRFVYTNQLHRQLFRSERWIGTGVLDAFPEAQARRILASDRRVLETGQPERFEETYLHQGEPLHLLVHKFPFRGPAGSTLIGAVAIDVTSLKRAQAEIGRQAAALEAANAELREADRYKDEFLGILSHELRTPLNFIISYASVLDEEVVGPLTQQEHAYVAKVLLGADRLLAMVDNLLEMSRFVAKKFKLSRSWVPYAALVEQVVAALAPVAAEKQVTLRAEARVPGEQWLDGEHVRRVLTNLVDNAIKFTGPGGQVALSAWCEGDRLVTEVRDTGVGIAAADLPKLFTRFKQLDMSATREAGGMGLGLALSKAIVEGHGGTIAATSRPGEGSCFRFELPLAEPEG
jgi:two-component system CheB/CheR fusion protein